MQQPQAATDPFLTFRNVKKTYDQKSLVVKDFNLEVKEGEFVTLLGPSGSGKSTLLSLLAGLDVPGSGDILFNGETFSGLTEDQRASIRRGRIGFVFQSFQLLQGLTALENVMLPLELMGLSVSESKKRSISWLDRVGLEARIHHRPRMLSGGEQQRVAVARAFVNEPALLFADEPTGNLDRKTGESITELLFNLNRNTGTTLILVTHDERLAGKCQRVFHLEDGHLNEVAA